MGSSQINLVHVVCLSLFTALSASTFISDVVFGHQVVNERRLLQTKKHCPVSFENQNYTIITSQCKGPDYDPNPCCSAFIEFACPFADYLNDLTNDCSTVMFSYINANGKYPLGLFPSLCRQGKEGLACLAPPPSDSDSDSLDNKDNGGTRITGQLLLMIAPTTLPIVFSLLLLFII